MSDHRQSRVMLPVDKARCEPMNACDKRSTCARYVAPIPRMGTIMGHDMPKWGSPCWFYISVESLRNQTPIAERRLHAAPEGLR